MLHPDEIKHRHCFLNSDLRSAVMSMLRHAEQYIESSPYNATVTQADRLVFEHAIWKLLLDAARPDLMRADNELRLAYEEVSLYLPVLEQLKRGEAA